MASLPVGPLTLRLLGRRQPRLRGRLRVPGLRSTLSIRRDRWGIPHVDAETDVDAWYGLGFCHAQDRAFQLEANLRAARGTLSAVFGPATLGFDRLARRLGFGRVAERQLPQLDPEIRGRIAAYVAGINAGLSHGCRRAPHELALIRARPTPWQPADVLAFAALQSFGLGANWDIELGRLKILVEDGPDALLAVDHGYGEWLPVTSPVGATAGPALGRLADDLAAFRAATVGAGASNAWALAGSRTASGHPILAGDPHLPPLLPPQWYLAHLRTPRWQLAGATLTGGPAFPVGHNGFAAWSITAALTDASDLFIEQLEPDGRSVRSSDAPEECRIIEEQIRVRGEPPVTEVVLITPRGPLVSPALDDVPHALSLRAVWLEPLPLRGFLDIGEARSFEDFRRAFAEWPGPALNVVYADADGHIGWQLIGQLPRRRSGYGTIPRPAWELDAGWDGLVEFDEMPHEVDPPTGWVANANNAPRPLADDDSPFLGIDWLDGYRMARISEVIDGADDWGVAECQRLQLDVTSVPWRELRSTVLDARPPTPQARQALDLLKAWDGRVSADSPAAAVYELFMAELAAAFSAHRAPNSWRWALGAGFGPAMPRTLLVARTASWLIRLLHDRPDAWEAAIGAALSSAVERLTADHGDDPAAWAWGHVRPLTLQHPYGRQPGFERSFNLGPVPWGGDSNTPAQASLRPLDPLANPAAVAMTRAVFDLGDLERSRYVLAGGQSGNPRSRHYRDLFEHWRRGEGVPILLSGESIETATVATLTLEPAVDSDR
jgi:penicillin G amidase